MSGVREAVALSRHISSLTLTLKLKSPRGNVCSALAGRAEPVTEQYSI